MPAFRDRRRAQAGTTLVELLVSTVIIGLALTIVVGVLSTGLLDSSLGKRNVAVQGVLQYEMEKVGASSYSASAQPYSDCFAVDNASSPIPAPGPSCPSGYTLRADVSWTWQPGSSTVQIWTIAVSAQPGSQIGSPLALYKVAHT